MSISAARRPGAPARPTGSTASPGWAVGGYCQYRNGVHELRLSGRPPGFDPALGCNSAEFSLIDEEDLLLLCFRFGEARTWSVADYRWSGRPGADHGEIPPLGGPGERRALLSAILDGGEAAVSCVNFTLSLDFTRALHAAIRERVSNLFDMTQQARMIRVLATRWPSLQALASRAEVRSYGNP